jgi:hypothetical protein
MGCCSSHVDIDMDSLGPIPIKEYNDEVNTESNISLNQEQNDQVLKESMPTKLNLDSK